MLSARLHRRVPYFRSHWSCSCEAALFKCPEMIQPLIWINQLKITVHDWHWRSLPSHGRMLWMSLRLSPDRLVHAVLCCVVFLLRDSPLTLRVYGGVCHRLMFKHVQAVAFERIGFAFESRSLKDRQIRIDFVLFVMKWTSRGSLKEIDLCIWGAS